MRRYDVGNQQLDNVGRSASPNGAFFGGEVTSIYSALQVCKSLIRSASAETFAKLHWYWRDGHCVRCNFYFRESSSFSGL